MPKKSETPYHRWDQKMKSLLRYASSLHRLLETPSKAQSRRQRNRFSISGDGYQSLEKRNLLTTFTVTTLQDVVADDGLVSLREAITAANTNSAFNDAAAGDATGDTIRFASQLAGQAIQLTGGQLAITDDLVIVGDVTLDAQNQSRILSINTSENVVLSRLTFVNGRVGNLGGAIQVFDGNLLISQAEFRSSSTTGFSSQGGAIYSSNSNLRIGRSTFAENISERGGAISGVDSNINVFQSTFTDNDGVAVNAASNLRGAGGAIESAGGGRLSVVQSTFSENSSSVGGAIFASSDNVFIFRTAFNENSSLRTGGAVSATGADRTVILESEFVGNRSVFGGGLAAGGTTLVTDTLFEANVVESSSSSATFRTRGGGGILSFGDLFVSDSRIINNTSDELGGGIAVRSGGSTLIADSIISGNQAVFFGGGISSQQSNISIVNSTVSSNVVTGSGSRATLGGGLFAVNETIAPEPRLGLLEGVGTPSTSTSVFISNSIFSSNVAPKGGGGVATLGVGLTVVDSTFRDNVRFTDSPFLTLQPLTGIVQDNSFTGGGGAIWHAQHANISRPLTVARSEFRGNEANVGTRGQSRRAVSGGAIAIDSSEAVIRDSEFFGNHSDIAGGAIGVQSSTGQTSDLRLVDNVFVGNSAGDNPLLDNIPESFSPFLGRGGAIYSDQSDQSSFPLSIFGGEFRGNFATNSGGAIFATSDSPQTGVLLRANSAGEDIRFTNNRALLLDGGAIAGDGVGLNVRDAFFSTNTARNGGAIFVEGGGELRLALSEFRRNAARVRGGAANYFDTAFIDFQNVFANNSAIVGPDLFEQT